MKEKQPLHLDLNHLFFPNISDGPKRLSETSPLFSSTHKALQALRHTGQLGFANLPKETLIAEEILKVADSYRGIQNVLMFGIGGSALGALSVEKALRRSFDHLDKSPRLFILDNIDPSLMFDVFDRVKDHDNLFVFVSKSGNTSETLAQYLFVKKYFPKFSYDRCVVITDLKEGFLRHLVEKEKIKSFGIPPSIGGRFSVFTPAGLFPLAVCGIDILELLNGAQHMETQCESEILEQNPAALLAVTLHHWLVKKKFSQVVLMPYSERLKSVSDWFAQLFAESLGKAKTIAGKEVSVGFTPIKSIGVTDQHSQLQLYLEGPRDKVVLFLEVENFLDPGSLSDEKFRDDRIDFLAGKTLAELLRAEKSATEESLREKGCPNATVKISEVNPYQIGQLYQMFMNMIPYLGAFLEINPFDQPAVEQIKKFTFGLMGKKGFEDFREKIPPKKDGFIF